MTTGMMKIINIFAQGSVYSSLSIWHGTIFIWTEDENLSKFIKVLFIHRLMH